MKIVVKLIFIVFMLISCKEFLDEKSTNRQAVPISISDLQALLDNQTFINSLRTPSILQSSADDTFVLENTFNGLSAENKLLYTWKPFDYFYSNDWSAAYHVIYTANYCLETLSKITKTAENQKGWDNIYGSAHFLKAYYYLGVLWAFAKEYNPEGSNVSKGIVLRNSSDFNVPSAFYSVEECYAEVIRLAEDCLAYLPEKPQVKARPSKIAANALLARALLSMGKYKEALKHSEQSLQLDNALIDFNKPEDGIKIDAAVPFTKFTKETIFYSEMTQKFNLHLGSGLADTTLTSLFEKGDLRVRAYYQPNGNYHKFKGTHSHSIQWLFSGLTTAEMYLINAECKVRGENLEDGMKDLNTLVKTRWDNSVPYREHVAKSKEEALSIVLEERRKELAMRGIRWSDIKRLNREGHNIRLKRKIGDEIIILEPHSEAYILPLPKDLEKYFR